MTGVHWSVSAILHSDGGRSLVNVRDGGRSLVNVRDGGRSLVILRDGGRSLVNVRNGGRSLDNVRDGGRALVNVEFCTFIVVALILNHSTLMLLPELVSRFTEINLFKCIIQYLYFS